MFEKNLTIAYLIDFYGDVLPAHTRAIMERYYEDDLSLAEIASSEGISRQGVRHIIKKGEDELNFLEQTLGLAAHYSSLRTAAKKLTELSEKLKNSGDAELSAYADTVRDCAAVMLSKN